MKSLKEIVFCITPFAAMALAMYLLGAFVAASWDSSAWDRSDRAFFGIMSLVFGGALFCRLDYGRKYETV